jgi:hypothetical protein
MQQRSFCWLQLGCGRKRQKKSKLHYAIIHFYYIFAICQKLHEK